MGIMTKKKTQKRMSMDTKTRNMENVKKKTEVKVRLASSFWWELHKWKRLKDGQWAELLALELESYISLLSYVCVFLCSNMPVLAKLNGKWTAFIQPQVLWLRKPLHSTVSTHPFFHLFTHTHSHTNGRQLLSKVPAFSSGTCTHTFTQQWNSHLELIGIQDTLTCRLEDLWIEAPTFRWK